MSLSLGLPHPELDQQRVGRREGRVEPVAEVTARVLPATGGRAVRSRDHDTVDHGIADTQRTPVRRHIDVHMLIIVLVVSLTLTI